MRVFVRATIIALAAIVGVNRAPAEEAIITGQILGEDSGAPLTNEVWIAARNGATGEWTRAALSKVGSSSYRLVVPSEGQYKVYPTHGPFWHDKWAPDRFDELAKRSFDVSAESGTTELNLTLPDPVLVRLRVVDAWGSPLEGARATISRMRPEYERDYGAMGIEKTTGEDGRCEWHAMPGHEIWVSAQFEGLNWTASEHFEASPGESRPEITLKLRRPGSITATLVDIDGHPMPNTGFRLTVHDLQGAYLKGTWASTDANGQFMARDFLVRDQLRISLYSSSKHAPDFETVHEGPADHGFGLGSIYIPASLSP